MAAEKCLLDRETVPGLQLEDNLETKADRQTPLDLPLWMRNIRADLYRSCGGFLGRHSSGRVVFLTSFRIVLLVAIVTMALGWLGKQGCVQQTIVNGKAELVTSGNRSFVAMCYSDIIVQFEQFHGFSMPYPFASHVRLGQWTQSEAPLLKLVIYFLVHLAAILYPLGIKMHLPVGMPIAFYFGLCCMFLTFVWIGIVVATRYLLQGTSHAHRFNIFLLAASPVAVLQAFTNFDLIPVFISLLILIALSGNRFPLAGLLLGIGLLSSIYMFVFGLAIALYLGCRLSKEGELTAKFRAKSIVQIWGVAILFFSIVIGVLALANNYEALIPYRDYFQAHEDIDSIYGALEAISHYTNFDSPYSSAVINSVVLVMTLIVLAWSYYIARHSLQANVYQVCLLLLAGVFVVGKMFKPQYSLWLLPLLVLASRHTKLIALWFIVDASCWFFRLGSILSQVDRMGLPPEFYGAMVLIRDTTLGVVVIATVLDMFKVSFHISGYRLQRVVGSNTSSA